MTLSATYDVAVTLNYAKANGSARAGEDYDAKSGTLAFAAGETSKTIIIAVKGDRQREASEMVFINLSGGALLLDSQDVGTILDHDWFWQHRRRSADDRGLVGSVVRIMPLLSPRHSVGCPARRYGGRAS